MRIAQVARCDEAGQALIDDLGDGTTVIGNYRGTACHRLDCGVVVAEDEQRFDRPHDDGIQPVRKQRRFAVRLEVLGGGDLLPGARDEVVVAELVLRPAGDEALALPATPRPP